MANIIQTPALEREKAYISFLETTVNALYRQLPSGERNYESDNPKIGHFSVRAYPLTNHFSIMWGRREAGGEIDSIEIADIDNTHKQYIMQNSSLQPQRLLEDTERVMDAMGISLDDDLDID